MDDELYSNYVNREPNPRNVRYIRRWHRRLLSLALSGAGDRPTRRVLEVGPGHGYFADECRNAGLDYAYCDTSPAVHRKMTELGFEGEIGLLQEVSDRLGTFDLVWMSHVLEHSPTWVDARNMVHAARLLLADGGSLVVVSPDVLSWRREFWNVDWSHGYPTSVRNVAQLLSDVGFSDIVARHHRNGSFSRGQRALMTVLSLIPHNLIDRVITPSRHAVGDGMMYSWKAVFGWRQIYVRGRR